MTRTGRAVRRRVATLAACAAALLAVGTLLPVAPGSARPTGGPWGTSGVSYLGGVVCPQPSATEALVSWPGSDGRPAFALQPVTGPAAGTPGAYDAPAVNGTSSPDPSAVAGLPDGTVAALARLIGAHGGAGGAVTGEVAAIAAAVHGPDPLGAQCLAAGVGGLSASDAASLAREAARDAGPYTVAVTAPTDPLVLGSPARIPVRVLSASGVAVPGVTVTLAVTGGRLARTTVRTGTDGTATARLVVDPGTPVTSVQLVAAAALPTGLTELDAPGAVPLVQAGDPVVVQQQVALPVDPTADPTVRATAAQRVVLPGSTVTTRLVVGGMRGHSATATVSAVGPLPYRADTGCAGLRPRDFPSGDGAQSATVAVVGDGSYPAAHVVLADAGCYLLRAGITTSDAVPQVTRTGVPGQVVTVVPAAVTATAGALSASGRLTTVVTLHSSIGARLASVTAQALGPGAAPFGACTGSSAVPAGARPVPLDVTHRSPTRVTLSADRPGDAQCWRYRTSAVVTLPDGQSLTAHPAPAAATLVLAPQLDVTGLTPAQVTAGGRVHATVAVGGTFARAGVLRLQLRRLDDGDRGCFGLDFSGVPAVASAVSDPGVPTTGDGAYTVTSPPLTSPGCWTVVPQLSLSGDTGPPASAVVPSPTTAVVTAVPVAGAGLPADHSLLGGDQLLRLVVAGVLVLLLVLGALVATVLFTRDDERGGAGSLDDALR